jgi:small-conductance mechanosensitive channel
MVRLILQQIPPVFEETTSEVIAFAPRAVGALAILLIGWLVGRLIAGLVRRLVDAVKLDQMVVETPLGKILGGTQQAVGNAFASLGKWFVYALAILAASNVLAISVLSEWMSRAVSYLPAFVAGLVIIVLGFIFADFVGDAIERTRAATRTAYTTWFATGVRLFLYFNVIVIGLATMGVDVSILYTFSQAFAWGVAAAVAIGIGIAVGWGSKDYVANNIDGWMNNAGRATPTSPQAGATDGGQNPPPDDPATGGRTDTEE